MKALVFAGPQRAEVAELDEPAVGGNEVLVATRQVGICHSDFELLEGRYIIPFEYPIIPGHEWYGEVVRGRSEGASASGTACGEARSTAGQTNSALDQRRGRRAVQDSVDWANASPSCRGNKEPRSNS